MELPVKVAIVSGTVLLFAVLFGWVGFPALFKYKIKSAVTLDPASEARTPWEKIPFPLDFQVYIFNVTNAKDVQNGDSPMLDEIGPFHYDEWKEKMHIVDNEKEDTVEFNPKMTWYFNQKKSGDLTGEEFVTIPHPLILSALLKTSMERPAILSLAFKAINSVFDNPETIFLTAKVKNILFDGVFINCTATDFVGQMACEQLKQEKNLIPVGDEGFLFSFFGHRNGTIDERIKVKRGIQNSADMNRVIEYKNSSKLNVWTDKYCNKLGGTEGTKFPPLISEGQSILAFTSTLCRNLDLKYVKKSAYRNIPVYMYTMNLGDVSKNPEEKCYCTNEKKCYRKGAIDLSKCMGAPFVATLPHFYDTDKSFLKRVRGLDPEAAKHQVEIYFEPITGAILAAHNRLQFNIPIERLPNITLTDKLREVLVPLFWIDESIMLNTTYLQKLDKQVFLYVHINDILKWTLVVVSVCGLAVSLYMQTHLKRGFSLSTFALREQELQIEAIPDKSAVISSLSEMVHKDKGN